MGDAERLDPAHLVDLFKRLPDDDKGAILHLAEHLARKADPVAWALDHAPLDDEPLTDEERTAIEAALAEPGPNVSLEDLKEKLGL